ncbi:U3-containing 90S pre-ribosomal complex subunit-domain containing protein [Kockovaella imperatae]|uniref:U3-containing 90S pre-ribosomal complex subunit-domain containing protein n=1 Tax=Kockovaella imperatae TaxID=4999 RepID=A0A1Y1UB39_9TREE|nr:U3-containing 90S pre-ribosomal complex subunit-domain containing protein [Kockovaella imperatae]ORX35253.1 U3-containing 90S pre-ribosomal complex subunit-domain containing protein [Kockovaella imperatae]
MTKGVKDGMAYEESRGDDLEDGLEVDQDFLASPGASGSGSSVGDGDGVMGDEEVVDEGEFFSDPEAEEQSRSRNLQAGAKRKGDDGEEDDATRTAEKKRRKKEREKRRKARRHQAHSPSSFSKPLSHLATSELFQLLLSSIRDTFPAASPMEIEDLQIPENQLLPALDTEHIGSVPEQSLLKDRLHPFLTDKKLPPSTPRVIVLSLSGLRCADVVREVKSIPGHGEVAKLFAKHLKYEDQVNYLAKTRTMVAVGTPARVGRLLAEGALKITKNTVILLDASFHDSKKRTLLTLPEARTELWKSVFSGKARDTIIKGGARVGAF